MTAQNTRDMAGPRPADTGQTDPLGPITMPERTLIGRRALALVGSTSLLAVSAMAMTDLSTICTGSSISAPR